MNRGAAILIVGLVALMLSGAALAGKGGAGKSTSSLTLVVVAADGARVTTAQPRYGDQITYDVSTTATPRPYVETSCFQDGKLVYKQSRGFFADYYAGTQMFQLGPTENWQGGAAACSARLVDWINGTAKVLSTTSFDVAG